MTEQGLEHLRSTVQTIIDRVKTEEGYGAKLKKDPVGTLTAAGVDKGLAQYIATEELNTDDSEVSGYQRCSATCDRYSCWVSACGNISIGGTN
jgi:hypothetical protein